MADILQSVYLKIGKIINGKLLLKHIKKMDNLIEYKGALPEDNTNTASDDLLHLVMVSLTDWSFYQAKSGKTTGWLGYTISKTTRYFEQLNNGIGFPAKYDRTHDLSLTATHELNEIGPISYLCLCHRKHINNT